MTYFYWLTNVLHFQHKGPGSQNEHRHMCGQLHPKRSYPTLCIRKRSRPSSVESVFFSLPNSQKTPWSRNNRRSFLSAVQVQTVMSVNRCIHLFSRLQRHISAGAARASAGSCGASPGCGSARKQHDPARSPLGWSRNASSHSSPPKAPDTSLFVPVSLKPDSPVDGSVGSELSQPLDKSEWTNMS